MMIRQPMTRMMNSLRHRMRRVTYQTRTWRIPKTDFWPSYPAYGYPALAYSAHAKINQFQIRRIRVNVVRWRARGSFNRETRLRCPDTKSEIGLGAICRRAKMHWGCIRWARLFWQVNHTPPDLNYRVTQWAV